MAIQVKPIEIPPELTTFFKNNTTNSESVEMLLLLHLSSFKKIFIGIIIIIILLLFIIILPFLGMGKQTLIIIYTALVFLFIGSLVPKIITVVSPESLTTNKRAIQRLYTSTQLVTRLFNEQLVAINEKIKGQSVSRALQPEIETVLSDARKDLNIGLDFLLAKYKSPYRPVDIKIETNRLFDTLGDLQDLINRIERHEQATNLLHVQE